MHKQSLFMVLDVSHVLLLMHDQHNGHCLACLLEKAIIAGVGQIKF